MRDEVPFHTGGCMDLKKLLLILLLLANICYADEIDINAYMEQYSKEVQQKIKANFSYKGEESATASVSYQINPDGSVEDIKVEKSGGADMDEVLINAVKKSAPFKPFPEDLNLVISQNDNGISACCPQISITVCTCLSKCTHGDFTRSAVCGNSKSTSRVYG